MTGSIGWELARCPVVVVVFVLSRPVADLVSSMNFFVRDRLFPYHWLVPNHVCCTTSKARCRASATEPGSNW